MNQSKIQSLIESLVNVAIGMVISVLLSLVVYPAFGHAFTLAQNVSITIIFTVASIVRSYCVRRWFNAALPASSAAAMALYRCRLRQQLSCLFAE